MPFIAAASRDELYRASSGPFLFQHTFTKENHGDITEFYDVGAELGRGAYGSAYQLTCRQTGVQRATKKIAYERVKDPAKFEREVGIAKSLDHPNLVRLFEIFRDDAHLYLVMELCTGGELFERIMELGVRGFGETEASSYVRQMLAALCYLHANHFAHRDVKPENFLLQNGEPNSALKLIDFGLACRFTPGVPMCTKAGTAYYVAPEVLDGSYDELCDVWSAGVVAYILLCGYPPFQGDTDREVLRRVKKGIVRFHSPDWDHVSGAGVRLITRMLEYKPARRTTAGEALKSTWLRMAPFQEETTAPPMDMLNRLQAFQRHSKLKRVALTAVAQQLPDEETAELQRVFRALDENGDGMLSHEEVREGLERLCGVAAPQNLEDTLRSVDSDGSGSLDYTEFVAALMDRRLYSQRRVCLAAFRTFDLNGDGMISRDELFAALGGGDEDAMERSPSAVRCDRMVEEADANGDGCIDFEEFFSMLTSGRNDHRGSTHGTGVVGLKSALKKQPARVGDGDGHERCQQAPSDYSMSTALSSELMTVLVSASSAGSSPAWQAERSLSAGGVAHAGGA